MTSQQVPMQDMEICKQEKVPLIDDLRKQAGDGVITISATCIKTKK